jgi:hypothetical protein
MKSTVKGSPSLPANKPRRGGWGLGRSWRLFSRKMRRVNAYSFSFCHPQNCPVHSKLCRVCFFYLSVEYTTTNRCDESCLTTWRHPASNRHFDAFCKNISSISRAASTARICASGAGFSLLCQCLTSVHEYMWGGARTLLSPWWFLGRLRVDPGFWNPLWSLECTWKLLRYWTAVHGQFFRFQVFGPTQNWFE